VNGFNRHRSINLCTKYCWLATMRPLTQHPFSLIVAVVVAMASANVSLGDQPLTETTRRLKDLDGHFPMVVPKTLEQWNLRAKELSLQVKVALGLHPMPTLSATAPTIYGRSMLAGYTIEKIYFESLPGFFVTGSLYRPLGVTVPKEGFPAVLYAHGHWENGRFYQATNDDVTQLLASGAERFENAAVNQMQAACVQLARMG
jgi:hypothetical protein